MVTQERIFFQAEDGIRDVERSRGLGDVYKRQIITSSERTQDVSLRLSQKQQQCFHAEDN